MFIGQYQHMIDDKNRIIIPAKFRDELLPKAIIAIGNDGCLDIYPQESYQRKMEEIKARSSLKADTRGVIRAFSFQANYCDLDKQGRVTVPAFLIERINSSNREVIIIGAYDHIEIWEKTLFEKYQKVVLSSLDEMAENL